MNHTLKKLSTGKVCTLFTPASRCLSLLIDHHNSVVTQKELMSFGWGDYEANITPNAFYQNIANIRRAFEEFLPGIEIVVTVKRVGLIIPGKINIIRAQPEERSSILKESSTLSVVKKKNRIIFPKNMLLMSSILMTTVVIWGSFYVYFNSYVDNTVFSKNYVPYNNIGNCFIFINKDGEGKPDEKLLKTINNEECSHYKYIYITTWYGWPRSSVLYCTESIFTSKERSCVTFFYGDHFYEF
ncbi:winged helix-turn-helix domain-containing protein [Enterobacter asburiae]|uniref:winged helix-turn-helix domain-containing protein n=1 Tax=Scandinavium sp. UTDF21-P1B TaxID=3446379 RepID=UPI003482BD38